MGDHYFTLDVPRTATQDEIKKAFRSKAQKFHPDVVGPLAGAAERAAAEAKFKEASAAYEVLIFCADACVLASSLVLSISLALWLSLSLSLSRAGCYSHFLSLHDGNDCILAVKSMRQVLLKYIHLCACMHAR